MEEASKTEPQDVAKSSTAEAEQTKLAPANTDSCKVAPDQQSHSKDTFVGPLKGKSNLRENRDMSEGLQNSRSLKLGLVSVADQQADTQS